ncbi:MAG: hypothetical protein LC130_23435 [Bryobacterales bacterium]|nr:hypothetical protein [Bryobacterales bacterium]
MTRWAALLACAISWDACGATIYLCKAYSGGSFWSSSHCSQQRALIERIVSVPDGMPFDQQVQLGEQDRANAARLRAPPLPLAQSAGQSAGSNDIACDALKAHIASIDARARMPQSAQTQDRLRMEKRKAQAQTARMGC